MQTTIDHRLVVLIDAENACARHLPQLMEIVATYGRPIIRRAYGDWTTPQLTPWKKLLERYAIHPVQQFRHVKAKNATDAALIMDAMQIVHDRKVDGICIAASDSDYTGLVARVRESGVMVYGFGDKCAAGSFVIACDVFVRLQPP